jgi:Holliday junction resolvasome RuvABC endonuclease subunit
MKYILGVDPGIHGAVAVLTQDGQLVEVFDMPTMEVKVGKATKNRISPELLVAELRGRAEYTAAAYIEAVSASPQMGVTSSFAFGEALGIIKGVLAAMNIPVRMVPPAKWKRDMNLNASKDGSRAKAIALWPAQAAEFKRVRDDGRAESALIAAWGIANPAR